MSSRRLDESKNPYKGRDPFAVLGVDRGASPRELDDAMEQLLEDLDYESIDEEEKQQKRQAVNEAYDLLRGANSRMAVEFFAYDASGDRQECKKAAQGHTRLEFDFGRILRGAEDVFPSMPELTEKQTARREIALRESVRLVDSSEKFRPQPKAEALRSIRFDR